MEKAEEKIVWSQDPLYPEKPGLLKRWVLKWVDENGRAITFLSPTEHQALKRYHKLGANDVKPITQIRYLGTEF